jgi:glycosyltransferase involved in cell wall biosynthesis
MLSVVSVVNDPAKASARLRAGLARQTAAHELIVVDNQDNSFTGAAEALNRGARQARGEWIAFLHQDVELLTPDWLVRAEAMLNGLAPEGWCGVAGRTAAGRWRGLLRDRAMVFGDAFGEPVEVQTLDELVLVHRNRGQGYSYFDAALTGWHAYGVDVCCTALRTGGRNYVLPLPVWHDSNSTNRRGLSEAHAFVWRKHRAAFRRIYTTCGVLPDPYGWSGSWRIADFSRRLRNWRHVTWLRRAEPAPFALTPWQALEGLTCDEPVVEVLHARAWFDELEGTAFTDHTASPRRVVHRFAGAETNGLRSDCVVLAPDLTVGLTDPGWQPPGVRRVLICLYLHEDHGGPAHWARLLRRSFRCTLAMEADETRWAILDVEPAGDTTDRAPAPTRVSR